MDKNLRTKQLIVRVSESELSVIDRMARERKMRRATFMRHSIIDKIPPVIPELNLLALNELSRIRGALNNLVKPFNYRDADAKDIADARELLATLKLTMMQAKESLK